MPDTRNFHASFGAGKMGDLVADVPKGLRLTPPHETGDEEQRLLRECVRRYNPIA
jgi:hypothetical protein